MRSKSEELMLRIREYIESYFERYSSTPTVREIAGAMRIAVSSAHRYLVAMAEKDMVFYENGALSTPKIRRMNPAVSPAAIVGSIPCGSPEEKEAQVEEYLPLSVSFFGKGDFYALRASGSSMTGAQINDGDLVIIRQQHTAQIGEIVVALTDEDKNTLKRLLYDDDRQSYYLHPENKDMEDIYVSGLRVRTAHAGDVAVSKAPRSALYASGLDIWIRLFSEMPHQAKAQSISPRAFRFIRSRNPHCRRPRR